MNRLPQSSETTPCDDNAEKPTTGFAIGHEAQAARKAKSLKSLTHSRTHSWSNVNTKWLRLPWGYFLDHNVRLCHGIFENVALHMDYAWTTNYSHNLPCNTHRPTYVNSLLLSNCTANVTYLHIADHSTCFGYLLQQSSGSTDVQRIIYTHICVCVWYCTQLVDIQETYQPAHFYIIFHVNL
jgi:hypothetical protein